MFRLRPLISYLLGKSLVFSVLTLRGSKRCNFRELLFFGYRLIPIRWAARLHHVADPKFGSVRIRPWWILIQVRIWNEAIIICCVFNWGCLVVSCLVLLHLWFFNLTRERLSMMPQSLVSWYLIDRSWRLIFGGSKTSLLSVFCLWTPYTHLQLLKVYYTNIGTYAWISLIYCTKLFIHFNLIWL